MDNSFIFHDKGKYIAINLFFSFEQKKNFYARKNIKSQLHCLHNHKIEWYIKYFINTIILKIIKNHIRLIANAKSSKIIPILYLHSIYTKDIHPLKQNLD